ncbi:MAG: S-layer homology domain-containing protein [Tumebacillaceae bacterium]
MSNRKSMLRVTTALTALLALTPLVNVVQAADSTTLTAKRDSAMNAFHTNMAKQEYKYVLGWPALTVFAAGDDVTSAKWSTTSGQNGVTARLAQIPKTNATQLTDMSTDFESELMGLIAAKQNPRSFARKDYIEAVLDSQLPDGKFADTIYGYGEDLLNAHIYGIISLYTAGVQVPNQSKAADYLLSKQHADGGFNWANESTTSNADTTAAALVAMNVLGYGVNDAPVQKALNYLKSTQTDHGGFLNEGSENPDSNAIVIEALLMYGIDPKTFAKGSGTDVLSAMLSYQLPSGEFTYTTGGSSNLLSTQNASLAIADVMDGKSIFQRLHDFTTGHSRTWESAFPDLPTTHPYYKSNMRLVNLGVMAGNPDSTYAPESPVTREQIAKILVFADDLQGGAGATTNVFRDLSTGAWSNKFVKVAYDKKYIVGTSANTFWPTGTVTGAQMMAFVVRMLGLEQAAQAVPNQKSWQDGYVKVATDHGLLYPDFDANKPATRAQVGYAIDRYYAEKAKLQGEK